MQQKERSLHRRLCACTTLMHQALILWRCRPTQWLCCVLLAGAAGGHGVCPHLRRPTCAAAT
jgi:hypothetical protein